MCLGLLLNPCLCFVYCFIAFSLPFPGLEADAAKPRTALQLLGFVVFAPVSSGAGLGFLTQTNPKMAWVVRRDLKDLVPPSSTVPGFSRPCPTLKVLECPNSPSSFLPHLCEQSDLGASHPTG